MSGPNVVVRALRLSKTYRAPGGVEVAAVQGVTLEVRAGELVLIAGPSGSGKTSLLSMIGGITPPTAGTVMLAGTELGTLDQTALAAFRLRHIGFVFQGFRLLDALTVVENLELPLHLAGMRRPGSRRRAMALLDELGLANRARFRPDVLSGGEKQRVAIGRALALDPPLLLADEPTGSLDSRSGRGVIGMLADAANQRGKAVLVVSHDPRIRAAARHVVRMEDGRCRAPRRPGAQS